MLSLAKGLAVFLEIRHNSRHRAQAQSIVHYNKECRLTVANFNFPTSAGA